MGEREDRLNKLAMEAIAKHERLLQMKTLELLLGSMVRRIGVGPTRAVLQSYIDALEEFC